MVGISGCDCREGAVYRHSGSGAAPRQHCAALAECLGELPGNVEISKLSKSRGEHGIPEFH
jgi:hypothetical protein